jgi:phage baseplate assembly protein W
MAKTINFKSVGITGQQTLSTLPQLPSIVPIGIKTPLQLGTKYGILDMHTNMTDTMADNMRNLILTNWGERLGQYFLGANLRPLTTEYSSQDAFDSEAVIRIKTAVKMWMPFVELIDYVSNVEQFNESSSTGVIGIQITYAIPLLRAIDQKLKVNLYVV